MSLLFKGNLVCHLTDCLEHQGTWFGSFSGFVNMDDSESAKRISHFKAFAEEWHQRLAKDESADPAEFEAFSDLFEPGIWQTCNAEGIRRTIIEAPLFSNEQVSWLYE